MKFNFVHTDAKHICQHEFILSLNPTENVQQRGKFSYGRSIWWHHCHQKWHRKLMLFHATYKSGTEFTIPAI